MQLLNTTKLYFLFKKTSRGLVFQGTGHFVKFFVFAACQINRVSTSKLWITNSVINKSIYQITQKNGYLLIGYKQINRL